MSNQILMLSPEAALNREYDSEDESTPYQMIRERTFKGVITRDNLYILQPEIMRRDRIVGDQAYDIRAMSGKMQVWLTIEHMVNIFHVDGYLSLCTPADKKIIYEIITLHLKCCKIHNLNVFTGEEVDLITLSIFDEFLQAIYDDSLYELRHSKGAGRTAAERFEENIGVISTVKDNDGYSGKRNRLFSKETIGDDDVKVKNTDDYYDPFNFGGDDSWT